jgi:hypothetical protein
MQVSLLAKMDDQYYVKRMVSNFAHFKQYQK